MRTTVRLLLGRKHVVVIEHCAVDGRDAAEDERGAVQHLAGHSAALVNQQSVVHLERLLDGLPFQIDRVDLVLAPGHRRVEVSGAPHSDHAAQ